ncbi:hypothetical protein ACHAXR_005826, partial [Thalassiosira sp. AJA248-18]
MKFSAYAFLLAIPAHPTLATNRLRGNDNEQHQPKQTRGLGLFGGGGAQKLGKGGCLVLLKASLCEGLDGKPVPCNEDPTPACADIETGAIYDVDNDMSSIRGRPDFTIDSDADISQSATTVFTGDAVINKHTGRMSFLKGNFSKGNGHGRGGSKGSGGRELAQTGDRTVLALKVIASDGLGATMTEFSLADSVFGSLVGGPDQVNLASQYTACSHGQLNFTPRPFKTSTSTVVSDAVDGVCTVNVASVASAGDSVMRNEATTAIQTAFGASKGGADYVMVCVPDASMGGIAYAYVNHWLSVYKNNWCTYPSAQLHEVGHNLNLAHSGETETYDDQSGFMGFSYSQDEQRMCFNGPKNYQLGWFPDRHVDLTSTESWSGRIYGQTVYDTTTSAEKMIIRISVSGESGNDLYVSFNHDALHHQDTREGQNQVLVHFKGGAPNAYSESKLRAKLSASGTYTTVDGFSQTITVGAINTLEGWAEVTVVYVTQCTQNSDCDDGLWCNGYETCDSNGQCQFGTPPNCSDGLICTDDICNESTDTCDHPPTNCLASNDPCATDQCIEAQGGCQYTCGA